MKYNLTKLSNNLEVLSVPVDGVESATLTVSVKAGSRNEDEKISGISHFLEHMAFKGGGKYKDSKAVSEAIDAIGGEFNAYTTKEWTQYYVKCRGAKIETAFDVLSDMLIKPSLRASDLKTEKGVIVEEIGMREDVPMVKVYILYDNLLYSGNDLGRDVIGTKETVTSFKRGDFVSYIDKHYFTTNMLVTVSGGISSRKVDQLTKKYFLGLKKGTEFEINKTVSNQMGPRSIIEQKDNEQTHLIVGFPGLARGNKDRFKEYMLRAVLGGGMSSRLFQEVREKRGLAYAVRTGITHYMDAGAFYTYAGVDPKRAKLAIQTILDQYYGLASGKYKISTKELNKAKEFIKGHEALALEDTSYINEYFGTKQLFLGEVITPDQFYKKIDKVTTKDILDTAKQIFDPKMVNLALIGPNSNKKALENSIK